MSELRDIEAIRADLAKPSRWPGDGQYDEARHRLAADVAPLLDRLTEVERDRDQADYVLKATGEKLEVVRGMRDAAERERDVLHARVAELEAEAASLRDQAKQALGVMSAAIRQHCDAANERDAAVAETAALRDELAYRTAELQHVRQLVWDDQTRRKQVLSYIDAALAAVPSGDSDTMADAQVECPSCGASIRAHMAVPSGDRPSGMHNPWDWRCSKNLLGEPTRPDARCPICSPVVAVPSGEQETPK